jgi:dihydrofolate reductase
MSALVLDMSISFDGYATAARVSDDEPMGIGGQRLHAWASGDDPEGNAILKASNGRVGGTIAGRRTYERSVAFWGADGPGGTDRTPTFIVSHSVADAIPEGGVYSFVPSPEAAVEAARAAAGDRPIDVFSPSIGRQLLRAGLVDELRLHVSPVVFGGGVRLLEGVGPVELELLGSRASARALHLHYAVRRGS